MLGRRRGDADAGVCCVALSRPLRRDAVSVQSECRGSRSRAAVVAPQLFTLFIPLHTVVRDIFNSTFSEASFRAESTSWAQARRIIRASLLVCPRITARGTL